MKVPLLILKILPEGRKCYVLGLLDLCSSTLNSPLDVYL